ncbi:biotin transporter BioY [Rhodococcus sp. D2-41]|uniref:Biotin transporter n=1 Tax=Speluncibacter jeojiensis TaxID=2710754 RepID=A0A9X4RD85_9ACTN|nr:biotin transporter BioY [Rhodococcus sp. D2-41]MDG3010907.1 biotin transporter BioY [Rhodococcus sp. D2-41]MDG3013882.1 biotin transporter BioY [Corynebacteriales bacterium D3-21]
MSPSDPRRRALTSRDLAQIAVFAALIVALGLPGQINIGSSGVPITLQTLGVMLTGSIIGARKGVLAVLAVEVLAAVGLPVLSGRGGLAVFAGPTVGFLVGWIASVAVIGALTARMMPRYTVLGGLAVNILGGIVVMYAFGLTGMMLRTDLTFWQALTTNAAFVPGDLVKAAVTAAVAAQVHRAYPGLIAPAGVRARAAV